MTPEPVCLIRRRQLPLLRIARSRLRDQPLQLRNAGAAIGARFQPGTDVRRRTRAARDGIADGVAADAEAGADDRAGIRKAIYRFARQQHAALVVAERTRGEQTLYHIPVAVLERRPDEQAGVDTVAVKGRRAI